MPVITLPDSRQLSYERLGDPDGTPLVVLHGTPGSWRQLAGLAPTAKERGYCAITPDRAGYGGSTWDPRRTIGSSARDVGSLIAELGIDTCAVVGISGGGPTALACGVLLGGKTVHAVTTVGGVGPTVPRDASLPKDPLIVKVAGRNEVGARALFTVMARVGRKSPEKALDRLAAMSADVDATLLRDDPSLRAAMLDDLQHASPTAARAAARDAVLFARAWDVDLGDTKVPVDIWHGTADKNVPYAHAQVVAGRCPNSTVHTIEGGGHLLLNQLDEILTTLSAHRPRAN
jgi:pimeloyl-ACP methyl ester carboxylesterase